MPSSSTAQKAAETRRKLRRRIRELQLQGLDVDAATEQARSELNLKSRSPRPVSVPRPRPASSGGAGGPAAPAPSAPAPAPVSAAPAADPDIASAMRNLAAVPDDPAADPAAATLALIVPPTWETRGKWFRCWIPGGKKKVQLPIEPKPGPFTPTEEIPDILGQPELLFGIAVAMAEGENSLSEGPTGVAKTTAYRWLAKQLNYNFIAMPCSRGLEEAHMVGEYLPHESANGSVRFEWTWGPVSAAVLASQEHPTILVFEELNRVGSVQVFARIYSLLDDTRMLEIKEKRSGHGISETLQAGKLYVGATQNPVDTEHADYIGVQEFDPALRRRFHKQIEVGYPEEEIEAEALRRRVKGLTAADAERMVAAATRVREAIDIRFPFSFPDMISWATGLPYYGWERSAEIAVVAKAHPDYKASIRDLLALQSTGASS